MSMADTGIQPASKKHSNIRLKRCSSSFQENPSSSRMGELYQNICNDTN